jgi:hypothetical protein
MLVRSSEIWTMGRMGDWRFGGIEAGMSDEKPHHSNKFDTTRRASTRVALGANHIPSLRDENATSPRALTAPAFVHAP